jgi:hypothetical protein
MMMGTGVAIVDLLDMLSRPRSCRLINQGTLLPIEIHGCVDDTMMDCCTLSWILLRFSLRWFRETAKISFFKATRLTPGTDIGRRQYWKSIG